MLTRRMHGDVVWVDVSSPTTEEVRQLMDEFGIDPLVANEIVVPSARNHVDVYEEYLYLVLHFPAFRHTHHLTGVAQEIDFILGKKWIVTTRYDTIDPLQKFASLFEVEQVLDKQEMRSDTGKVFYYMLLELYRAQGDELAYLSTRLDEAEERVFSGDEKRMVFELAHIGRDVLNFTQALSPHRTILDSLETPGVALLGYEFARRIRRLQGEYDRLDAAIHEHHASLKELRETNNALLTTKQNEIMRIFTILAFITFPLSLMATLFGMNVQGMPIVGSSNGFWIVLSMMATLALSFLAFFKWKNWL